LLWGETWLGQVGWVLIFPDRLFLVSLDFALGRRRLSSRAQARALSTAKRRLSRPAQIQKRVVSSSLLLCGRTRTRMFGLAGDGEIGGGVGVRGDDLDMLTGQSGFHLVERNGAPSSTASEMP